MANVVTIDSNGDFYEAADSAPDATTTSKGLIQLAGDLTGTAAAPVLTATGVTAGTYNSVTVDAKGRITAGSTTSFDTSGLVHLQSSPANSTQIGGIIIEGGTIINVADSWGYGLTLNSSDTNALGIQFNDTYGIVGAKAPRVLSVNRFGSETLYITSDGTVSVNNATVNGTLTASGAVTASSTLAVTGALTANSTLNVTGAVTANSTITASGTISTTSGVDISSGRNISASGTISATGSISSSTGTVSGQSVSALGTVSGNSLAAGSYVNSPEYRRSGFAFQGTSFPASPNIDGLLFYHETYKSYFAWDNTSLVWNPVTIQPNLQASNNLLLNGDFGLWQRNTALALAFNTIGYCADRWKARNYCTNSISSVMSQMTYTPGSGQLPGSVYEPNYYLRWTQGGAGNAGTSGSNGVLSQHVENLTQFGGKTVVLSFYARSVNAATQLVPTLYLNFGTGGSAQQSVVGSTINLPSVSTTGAFTRYEQVFTIPSLSGLTVASDSNLQVVFNNNVTTYQVNIDFALVKLEFGNVSTPFVPRHSQVEYQMCLRYYQKSFTYGTAPASNVTPGRVLVAGGLSSGSVYYLTIPYPTPMRANPTVTIYNPSNVGGANQVINYNRSTASASVTVTGSSSGKNMELSISPGTSWAAGDLLGLQWTADAEF